MTSPVAPPDNDEPALPPGPPPVALAVALDLVTRYRLRLTDPRDGRLGLLGGDAYLLGAAQWTGRRAAFVGFYRPPSDPQAAARDLDQRLRAAEAWGNERLGAQGAERCDVLLIALGSSPQPGTLSTGLGGVQVGALAVDEQTGGVLVLAPVPRNLPSAGEVRAHARAVLQGRPVPTLAAVDLAERQIVAGGYAQPARRALSQQTVVTYGLIGLFVVLWLLENNLRAPLGGEPVEVAMGALVNSGPLSHDWWRYVASGFLHLPRTPIHILFNGVAMLYIGRLVEQLYGRLVLLGVFLITVVTGGLFWVGATALGIASPGVGLGASGGIMGLIGLLLVLGRVQGRDVPVGVVASIRQYALTIVALNVVTGFVLRNSINNFAHAGGLLGGILLGLWLAPRAGVGGRELKRWEQAVLGAVIVVAVVALGAAAQHAYTVLTAAPVLPQGPPTQG
ncbi:MAG TPA: rhomboid family intramembrane serine protease [Candidatus Angelobacter sp.]|jgi:membrane associated rhomboid family serine protease|nr:rhomboid family intramembrane serine protease [Candidatus Angelobacter sp.]